MDRYARQEAIEGWDQRRLSEATLAIAGTGPTALLAGMMAAAMGFGRLLLLPGKEEASFALPELVRPSSLPGMAWCELFKSINPQVTAYAIPVSAGPALWDRLPDRPDGLIAAGNDAIMWHKAAQLAQQRPVAVAAGCAAGAVGLWGMPKVDARVRRFDGRTESPLMAQIIAGLLVEEIRKALMPLRGESGRVQGCQLVSPAHWAKMEPAGSSEPIDLADRRVALVGAGALGTWCGMALGLSKIKAQVQIFDSDVVEETNLNRQVLFADAVGRSKALVLAERLQGIFPHLTVSGYGVAIDDDNCASLQRASLLAACPDNFTVRALLNRFALQQRKALLNGGTSAFGGSCAMYVPQHTSCFSCRLNIDALAAREREAQGCGMRVESSVVTSNAIIGALMAWMAKDYLKGGTKTGIWEYDGRAQSRRLGVHSRRPACRCHMA